MPQDEAACALGQRYRKKYLLTQIYVARTIAAAAFILAPGHVPPK